MKKIMRLGIVVAAVAVPLALAAPRAPAAPRLLAASVHYTGDWAGYGAVGGRYHDVQAVWQVPAIPATTSRAYAYFWVGLGGDGGSGFLHTLLFGSGLAQIGIIEISGPGAGYYAFWEAIPRTDRTGTLPSSQPHLFRARNGKFLSVKPGDSITASVTVKGGTYYLKESDKRGSNTIWSTPAVPVSAAEMSNDSAEVVAEDPSGTPLAHFGHVFFNKASVDGKPIGSTNPVEFQISPYPFSPVYVSPIGGRGINFSVTGASEPVPTITSAGTYTSGAYVYFDIHYSDPGHDAEGFGFVGVNGSGWAEETHPFSSPSYGIVGQDSIAYPFNEACGTAQQYSSYVKAWIYDTAGDSSTPVVINLVCASAGGVG